MWFLVFVSWFKRAEGELSREKWKNGGCYIIQSTSIDINVVFLMKSILMLNYKLLILTME